jgi:hypothetical protein
MGGYIKRDVQRVETSALNQKINKEVFDAFKDECKRNGYPLNVMLETFMRQYAAGRFKLDAKDILKFKDDGKPVSTLNTTFNKEIYLDFKDVCKTRGFFVKHVITAFMEQYATGNLIAEYIDITETK